MPLTVAGNVESVEFQEARLLVEALERLGGVGEPVEVRELLESPWEQYAERETRRLGGPALKHGAERPLVFHDTEGYLGGLAELYEWAGRRAEGGLAAARAEATHDAATSAARQRFAAALAGKRHASVTLQFGADETRRETVVFRLYPEYCPRACDNFVALLEADEGGYRGTELHRVVQGGWIQGGDVVDSSGANSVAAGGGTFPDECFTLRHDEPLTLSMANTGRHTNGSQFFVTLAPQPSFDGTYVAFGRVIRGASAVRAASRVALKNERPVEPVTVVGGGTFSAPSE